MGLCVGASVLSLCEFIDFLFIYIIHRFQTSRKVGASVKDLN